MLQACLPSVRTAGKTSGCTGTSAITTGGGGGGTVTTGCGGATTTLLIGRTGWGGKFFTFSKPYGS